MTPHENTIPEVLLYNTIQGVLKYLREDIQSKPTSEETILYSIFQDLGLEKHNYLREGVDLFGRDEEHPRHVDCRLFFDAERAKEPTIHVSLASDDLGEADSIGFGLEQESYELPDIGDNNDEPALEFGEIHGRTFTTNLSLVITSSSHHEVLLIYHTIKAALISVFESFELNGFQNLKITGREIQIREDLIPTHVFSRAISIRGFYETRVRKFFNYDRLYGLEMHPTDIKPYEDT